MPLHDWPAQDCELKRKGQHWLHVLWKLPLKKGPQFSKVLQLPTLSLPVPWWHFLKPTWPSRWWCVQPAWSLWDIDSLLSCTHFLGTIASPPDHSARPFQQGWHSPRCFTQWSGHSQILQGTLNIPCLVLSETPIICEDQLKLHNFLFSHLSSFQPFSVTSYTLLSSVRELLWGGTCLPHFVFWGAEGMTLLHLYLWESQGKHIFLRKHRAQGYLSSDLFCDELSCVSPHSYAEGLAPSTSECDGIQRQGLYRGNSVKMRSGMSPNPLWVVSI